MGTICQNAFLLTATQITLRWEISSILAKLFFSIERLVDRSRFPALWFLNRDCISQLWVLSLSSHFFASSQTSCQSLWCKSACKQSPQASSTKGVKELRQPWIFPARFARLLPWDFVSSEEITSSLVPCYLEISKRSICTYCLIKPHNSFRCIYCEFYCHLVSG